MPKNILIFSDGTGQFGGLKPDQRLSNVYKIYRASRPRPENGISPDQQVAFYDAGLGTSETDKFSIKKIGVLFGSAFGTGISQNITECYEAILKHYEEGDRIFLFGFSRGAYTARCVANVLNLCGIPSKTPEGGPIPRHGLALRKIAEEAVVGVYEFDAGNERGKFEVQKEEKARRFREKYSSQGTGSDGEAQGNVAPYFIGVFDTVAALGTARAGTIVTVAFLVSIAAAVLSYHYEQYLLAMCLAIPAIYMTLQFIKQIKSQFKWIGHYPKKNRFKWHWASWRSKNYDKFLDTNVGYARHARSIDEDRERFPIVGWGHSKDVQKKWGQKPGWLEQVWFSGNHSDIGGSYPEAESRLSDHALQWMLEELAATPQPMLINMDAINPAPCHAGLQHDEVKSTRELYPRWVPKWMRVTWNRKTRSINSKAVLHQSVLDRFEEEVVSIFDKRKPYRPPALRNHEKVTNYYTKS